jgi:hypothetical protein
MLLQYFRKWSRSTLALHVPAEYSGQIMPHRESHTVHI